MTRAGTLILRTVLQGRILTKAPALLTIHYLTKVFFPTSRMEVGFVTRLDIYLSPFFTVQGQLLLGGSLDAYHIL